MGALPTFIAETMERCSTDGSKAEDSKIARFTA
jgi:hypothetical protein